MAATPKTLNLFEDVKTSILGLTETLNMDQWETCIVLIGII